MNEAKSKNQTQKTVDGQGMKMRGTVSYLYGSVMPGLTDAQACLLFREHSLESNVLRNVQTSTLPQPASADTGAGEKPLLFYYPFGYAFVQFNLPVTISGLSQTEEQSLFALFTEEKNKNDRLAGDAFAWISLMLSLPFVLGHSLSKYVIVTLEQLEGGGAGWTPQMIGFFRKSVCSISGKKIKDSPPYREHESIQITFKTKETVFLESEHGLIVADPKNIDSYLSTILFNLALDQRLEAFERELDRQRHEAFQYSKYTGKATYKSLALQEKFQGGSEKVYNQTLILSELSKCLWDPKSVLPSPRMFNDKIYSAFEDNYQFEDREEIAWDGIETLQDIFDVCCDRVSEFKYFFHEAMLEIIIAVILLAELIFLILERE